MRISKRGCIILFASFFIVSGCTTASSPTSAQFAYTPGPTPTVYSGTISDTNSGSGTVKVSLTNAAGLTSGTWDMSFGGKADPEYVVSGTLSGNDYTAKLSGCVTTADSVSCTTNCTFSFAGTFTSSGLSGTYTANPVQSCPVRTGNVNATKQ
jgi:hypothetical protein